MFETTLQNFYIGDLVEVIGGDANPHGTRMRLYDHYVESDRLIPLVNDARTVYAYEYADNLKLIERGNYFKWKFGMREQMCFYDIAQEATFWRSVGEMLELRNPRNGFYYEWELDEAIAALEDGTAHAFFDSSGGPGRPFDEREFGGYVCKYRDVAERMRRASLDRLRSLARELVDA